METRQRFTKVLRESRSMQWWRQQVLKRDSRKCCWCGSTEKPLHVDHRIPLSVLLSRYETSRLVEAYRDPLIFDPINGRVLCSKCHLQKTEKDAIKYGWGEGWLRKTEKKWRTEPEQKASLPPKKKKTKKKKKKRKKQRVG
jgi:5-methylcytosine-specific restriction endonuclease McrA